MLPAELTKAGAIIEDVPVYTVKAVRTETTKLLEQIKAGNIDFLTFTSPSTVHAFFEQIDCDLIKTSNIKIASIGPVTTEQLETMGLTVQIEAPNHTIEGLITAMKENRR